MMDIPKFIKDAITLREQRMREEQLKARPRCWKQLGELSKNHAHDENGFCIKHNWSKAERLGNWRKAK